MGLRYVWEKWNVGNQYIESNGFTPAYDGTSSTYMTLSAIDSSDKLFNADGYSSSTFRLALCTGYTFHPTGSLGSTYYFSLENAEVSSFNRTIQIGAGRFFGISTGGMQPHVQNRFNRVYKAIVNLTLDVAYKDGYYRVLPRQTYGNYFAKHADAKGPTSYGNLSSASSSAYPIDGKSGSYWYVSKGSDTIDPASVTYPASPNGGELIDITIAPSTGIKFGGTVKYKVEYQLDGGSWQTAVDATTTTTVSVLIPAGTQTFRARATASDNMGFTSTTAVTGATVSVVNNAAPVINCGTSSLGEIAEPFSVSYSVSDEDGDTMTITEKIDGTVIRSYSAPSGSAGEQTFSPDAMQWLTTLNGSHTATITADDGKGGVTTHSISFTRAVYTMSVTLEEPMETDAAITKCVVNIARNLPVDAEWSLLVTNNAFDPDPVWEDITQYVKNGWNWVFENQTVTSGRYGFNFKLTCARGASGQGGSVDTISGGFE